MASTNVLLLGGRGLGVEIGMLSTARFLLTRLITAKNVALAGIHSLTVHDNRLVTQADLGAQVQPPQLCAI